MFILGVDNVLQFTVVLASGEHVTANAYQHSDLFWALRGGGGGTYGVVTSATYKTHPSFPVVMSALTLNFTSPEVAADVLAEFIRTHPHLTDLGWGGYSSVSKANFQALWVAPNSSAEVANATLWPFVEFVRNASGTDAPVYTLPYPSFFEWLSTLFLSPGSGSQVGAQVEVATRLLPKDIAGSDPAKVAKIMLSLEDGVAIK